MNFLDQKWALKRPEWKKTGQLTDTWRADTIVGQLSVSDFDMETRRDVVPKPDHAYIADFGDRRVGNTFATREEAQAAADKEYYMTVATALVVSGLVDPAKADGAPVLKPEGQCQWSGCTEPAEALAFLWATDERKGYCLEHVEQAVEGQYDEPEDYAFVSCPNCSCRFGVPT